MPVTLYNFTLYDPTLTVSLSLGMDNFIYEQLQGIELPPIERYIESSPLQHGASDYGFRLSSRSLSFQLHLRANSPLSFYTLRSELIHILRPYYTLAPSILETKLPDESIWRMQVFCTSLNFTPYANVRGKGGTTSPYVQTASFTLSAPNPVWYQHTGATTTYFYQADIPSTKNITYTGSWLCHPYPFSVRGPIAHPILTNLSADTKLDLDYIIPNNQTVLIDLRPGYKTILLGSTSLLPYLSADSDLDTFYFLPTPEAMDGLNSIKVEGTSLGANTRVAIAFTPTRLAI